MRDLERSFVAASQLILIGDALFIILSAFLTTLGLYGEIGFSTDRTLFILTSVIVAYVLLTLLLRSMFARQSDIAVLPEFVLMLISWAGAAVVLLAWFYFSKTGVQYSRLWFGIWFLGTPALLLLWRAGAYMAFEAMGIKQYYQHRTLVVLDGSEGSNSFADLLQSQLGMFKIVRTLKLSPDCDDTQLDLQVSAIRETLARNEADTLIVAPLANSKLISRIRHGLRHFSLDIFVSPSNHHPDMVVIDAAVIDGIPLLAVQKRPLAGSSMILKNIEDRVIGSIMLLFFAPVMLIIGLLIRMDSKGPALFKQKRHGFNHDEFTVYKFRTMTTMDDGSKQAARNDMRITRIGKWLRRTSLDELPQLINVVQGRMSLVGPRPHPLKQNTEYGEQVDLWLSRHRMKPGITGWAQINGYRGEITSDDELLKRVEHDLYYIDHWSILFDLRILVATPIRGFVHPKAY